MATGCCDISLSGISKDCMASAGGIREAWIGSACDVTITVNDDTVVVTDVTPGEAFKHYSFNKNTGSVTTIITKDVTTGTLYYSSEIVLQFLRWETAKMVELRELAVGDLIVIIRDSNNQYWLFGYTEPVQLSAGTIETGTAKADFNGYNITLLDESDIPPLSVPQSVIEKLFPDE